MKSKQYIKDLKGFNQLVQEGVLGLVDTVDSMHQNVLNVGGSLNKSQQTTGLTGLIYRGVRVTTRVSSRAFDFALSTFTPLLPDFTVLKNRPHWVSMLNGVMGDYLAETDNSLALDMTLHYEGQEISLEQAAIICSNRDIKPLILIHGLCMPVQGWLRKGHDHGQGLATGGAYAAIYINYNSGMAIVDNGQKLADLLANLTRLLPDNQHLNVLAYSMGGLVIRSALQTAAANQSSWSQQIDKLVFLGTPHYGALLEKTGHLVDFFMSINPFSAPIAQLTTKRSQGIKDLRVGRISNNDKLAPWPQSIKTYAIAANLHSSSKAKHKKLLGDGLVTVNSALGRSKQKNQHLGIAKSRQITVTNVSHLGLLSNLKVYKKLQTIFGD